MNPGEPLTVEASFLRECRYKPATSRFAKVIRSAGGGGTFSHVQTVLQDRPTTAQKLVVRHPKKHGFGPRIANRLVTRLYQHSWAYLHWGVYHIVVDNGRPPDWSELGNPM